MARKPALTEKAVPATGSEVFLFPSGTDGGTIVPMPRRELKEALGALRQELESGGEIGPDDRAALVQAMQEIHEALDQADPGDAPSAAGPLSRRVSELIEEFETSHPKFAEILSSLSESLANLGI
jgi:hypothetical protein